MSEYNRLAAGTEVIVLTDKYGTGRFGKGSKLIVANDFMGQGYECYPAGNDPSIKDSCQYGCLFFKDKELKHSQTLEEQKQELFNQLEQINIRIADEKEKARMQLGEKEIEIKLTLNELAWVVTNVGNHGVMETEEAMKKDAFLTSIPFKFKSPVVCADGHYDVYNKLGSLLEQTIKDNT